MSTQRKKKFFSQVISITGGTAISLADLMKSVGWGFARDETTNEIDTTTPTADSFMADDGSIIPLGGTLYVGYDEFVRDAAAAGPPRVYQGAPTAVNVLFALGVRSRSIVDTNNVWLYSALTQDISVVLGGI